MTITRAFVDSEDMAKSWLLTTSVATLVTVGGKKNVFLALPTGSPLPAVAVSRAGGAPQLSDVPTDEARMSFQIFAKNRPQAKSIKVALIGELESLCDRPVYVDTTLGGRINNAVTLSELWSPDPVTDLPRYIVDAYLYIQAV